MKPSDFFLSRRQFFGLLVPGTLWLAMGLWVCGFSPLDWFEKASGRDLVLFIGASYVIGYFVQTAAFATLYWLKRARAKSFPTKPVPGAHTVIAKLKSAVRQAVRSDPQLAELSEHHLGQFCKWYAAKDSSYFQSEFSGFEDEINLTISTSLPMIILGIVGEARAVLYGAPITEHKLCYRSMFFLLLVMGCYMFWRFVYLWRAEEEAWYRAFLFTRSAGQDKFAGKAGKRDTGDQD